WGWGGEMGCQDAGRGRGEFGKGEWGKPARPVAPRFCCDRLGRCRWICARARLRARRDCRHRYCESAALRQRHAAAGHPVTPNRQRQWLDVHILEAGYEVPGRPAVLLHGFPELAYSWRKVMLPLAAAEYHVIAPISGAMAAPLAGTTPTTPIPIPSASSTWSAMPWDSCSRSAIARWRAWLGTMLARRSRRGARSSGRMYFDR